MAVNELSISLPVAERSYRLVVTKDREELFRKAAKRIEERMKAYSGSYAYKDNQDLLAMVALEFATSYLQNEQLLTDHSAEWTKLLTDIDHTLDANLKD
jgi:cell division protein ZapA (FtsZ GTPase activity inhibitor)